MARTDRVLLTQQVRGFWLGAALGELQATATSASETLPRVQSLFKQTTTEATSWSQQAMVHAAQFWLALPVPDSPVPTAPSEREAIALILDRVIQHCLTEQAIDFKVLTDLMTTDAALACQTTATALQQRQSWHDLETTLSRQSHSPASRGIALLLYGLESALPSITHTLRRAQHLQDPWFLMLLGALTGLRYGDLHIDWCDRLSLGRIGSQSWDQVLCDVADRGTARWAGCLEEAPTAPPIVAVPGQLRPR